MEDWKNDKAEFEMKMAEKEMMEKAALEKVKKVDEAWSKVKENLYVGDSEYDKFVDGIVSNMREIYELPTLIKKTND